ncbi:MAG: hypothetical protein ACWGSQ_07570, partial [Longimicrobiales bacterium]
MRSFLRPVPFGALGLLLLAACAGSRSGEEKLATPDTLSRSERLEGLLTVLAADSLEGRMTASRGAALAADFIAGRLEEYGLEPAFNGSFFQTVPLVRF